MTLSLALFTLGAALSLVGLVVGVANPGHNGKAATARLMSSSMVLLAATGAVLIAVSLAVHLM